MDQLAHLKILITDDSSLMRKYISSMLSGTKVCEIQDANDGDAAIAMIEEAHNANKPFNIVFLDWNMPRVSGFEVLCFFRAKPEYAGTAFVMLTAESDQKNILKAIKAGATAYILKPVSEAKLAKKFVEILAWFQTNHKNQM